jgi:carbon-monoxide dehydrogenase large subunit
MGTKNQGQGHETMFKQILHEKLGIDPNEVQYIDGDTDRVAFGMGTNGSRSTVLGGSAVFVAANKVIEKGKLLAGHLLEADKQDIEFSEGNFKVKGTDKSVPLKEVAKAAFTPAKWPKGFEGGLYENATFKAERDTYPNGCHICELEIDPDTATIEIKNYTVMDDFGMALNPLLLQGQVHGGIGQGVGQALTEHTVYDKESGQLLSGSLMDYAFPRADIVPHVTFDLHNSPCKTNPLGVKGAGEAGAIGAPPAVINAIVDAIHKHTGVKHIDMPVTPDALWSAIASSQAKKAA